jgi:hypothetical protein
MNSLLHCHPVNNSGRNATEDVFTTTKTGTPSPIVAASRWAGLMIVWLLRRSGPA